MDVIPIHVLDTAGLRDPGDPIERVGVERTRTVIEQADLVLFVFSAVNPWGASAWEFLKLISKKWLKRVVFVLQQADLRSPEEIDAIKKHLEQTMMERLGQSCPIFPVAAKKAFIAGADLEPVLESIAGLLRAGGLVLVSEFSWDAYDERAASWVAEHDPARDGSVAAWHDEHEGLHSGERVRSALDEAFERRSLTNRPYLAPMVSRPDLERGELAAIERGELPAIGWWYAGAKKTS